MFLNHKDHKNEGFIPATDLEKSVFLSFQRGYIFQVVETLQLGISLLWGEIVIPSLLLQDLIMKLMSP